MIGGADRDSINSFARKRLSDDTFKSGPNAGVNRNPSDQLVDFDGTAIYFDFDVSSVLSPDNAWAASTQPLDDGDCSGSDKRPASQDCDKVCRSSGVGPRKEITNGLDKRNRDVEADPERTGPDGLNLYLRRRIVAVYNSVCGFDKISERKESRREIAHVHNPALDRRAFIDKRNIRVTD